MRAITETNLPLRIAGKGKVRDMYSIDQDRLLVVSTDRISCFDVVLQDGIPGKGEILTNLAAFWFVHLRKYGHLWGSGISGDHLLSTDVENEISDESIFQAMRRNDLIGRSMVVWKMDSVIPFECVARGVLTGSAWSEYKTKGTVGGEKLPWSGLKDGDELPRPIFTPATKSQTGHDINISKKEMVRLLEGFSWPKRERLARREAMRVVDRLEEFTINSYVIARRHALDRGIDIRDTKLEFGMLNGEICLIDEVFTPDSSRFWDPQLNQSFDKQYVRDYLERVGWNKEPPAPSLPQDVIKETAKRYQEVYERLTR